MKAFDRNDAVHALRHEAFDVVIIGAGMTGAGVAVDAAQRGLRVALVDAGDVASGTSSKSSKMVHGGLRYLQQREFGLVYENLRERQRLLDNAPHLVRVLPFLIPLFGKNGVVSKTITKSYATALRIYDLTGGWRIGKRYRRVDRSTALGHLPTLNVDRLVAGFLYFDARGDDARVALTLARTAADQFGAVVANYVRATGFSFEEGRVSGVHLHDVLSGDQWTVATSSVVNASGVWADEVAALSTPASVPTIRGAKGVHLSVPSSRLPADVAAVLAVPGDRRSIFVVPFEEAPFTFVGTTDTAYDDDLNDPLCLPDDVTYLLNAVNASTSSNLTSDDVTAVWAGLRPLIAPENGKAVKERTADLSRRHHVTTGGDGVVHITGGKWTTYRKMAEDAVDALETVLGKTRRSGTKNLSLFGAPKRRSDMPTNPSLERHLFWRYGTASAELLRMIEEEPELGATAIEGLPYVIAEFVYGAQHELAVTLIDLLTRRTRAHLQDARATARAASAVAAAVAPSLGWDAARITREVAAYRELVAHEFTAAGLSLKGIS